MRIRKYIQRARKNFRARHNKDNKDQNIRKIKTVELGREL